MSKWKVRVPGYDFWDLYGDTERDIRLEIRTMLGVERVPSGTWIERVNERDEKKKLEHNREVNKEVLEHNSWLCLTDLM